MLSSTCDDATKRLPTSWVPGRSTWGRARKSAHGSQPPASSDAFTHPSLTTGTPRAAAASTFRVRTWLSSGTTKCVAAAGAVAERHRRRVAEQRRRRVAHAAQPLVAVAARAVAPGESIFGAFAFEGFFFAAGRRRARAFRFPAAPPAAAGFAAVRFQRFSGAGAGAAAGGGGAAGGAAASAAAGAGAAGGGAARFGRAAAFSLAAATICSSLSSSPSSSSSAAGAAASAAGAAASAAGASAAAPFSRPPLDGRLEAVHRLDRRQPRAHLLEELGHLLLAAQIGQRRLLLGGRLLLRRLLRRLRLLRRRLLQLRRRLRRRLLHLGRLVVVVVLVVDVRAVGLGGSSGSVGATDDAPPALGGATTPAARPP